MEVDTSSVLVLPYTASSVGVARRRLVSDLTAAGVRDGAAHDAALVLSELISNALRHATPLPEGTLKVTWNLHWDNVEVAVSDGGGESAPRVRQPSHSSPGGRGLGIVARLSLRWGTYAAGDGAAQTGERDTVVRGAAPQEVTVWAQLPVQYGNVPALVIASSRDA